MDAIAEAIAAADAKAGEVALVQVGPITIASTGRPVVLMLPVDLTGPELLELVSWMTSPAGLGVQLARLRGPSLALPGGVVMPIR